MGTFLLCGPFVLGETYEVRVRMKNDNNEVSGYSDWIEFTTDSVPQKLGKPQNQMYTEDPSDVISWDAPTNICGKIIEKYQVRVRPFGDTGSGVLVYSGTDLSVSATAFLTGDGDYEMRTRGRSGGVNGQWAAWEMLTKGNSATPNPTPSPETPNPTPGPTISGTPLPTPSPTTPNPTPGPTTPNPTP